MSDNKGSSRDDQSSDDDQDTTAYILKELRKLSESQAKTIKGTEKQQRTLDMILRLGVVLAVMNGALFIGLVVSHTGEHNNANQVVIGQRPVSSPFENRMLAITHKAKDIEDGKREGPNEAQETGNHGDGS